MLLRAVLLLGVLPAVPSLQAAVSDGTPVHVLPRIDVEPLLREDEQRQHRPYRYGVPLACRLDCERVGTWSEREDGSSVWRLNVNTMS